MTSRIFLLSATALAVVPMMAGSSVSAAVTISSAPTSNIACTGGVCTPTAKNAVLNVSQLEGLLASGSVTVNTAGATSSDIVVANAVTWASTKTLTLDAYESVTIDKPISVSGSGGLTILTNDGGPTLAQFSFGSKGYVTFLNLSSLLTINGSAYTLVDNIATLASDIAANPSGYFALAGSYNATADGTYASSPIPTTFTGCFDGLGNAISHLTAKLTTPQTFGLFEELGNRANVQNLNLTKETISGSGAGINAGGLVGTLENGGSIFDVSANVKIIKIAVAGGLVATNYGSVYECSTSGTINTGNIVGAEAGGVIGEHGLINSDEGDITQCYSSASVTVDKRSYGGGLIGYMPGSSLFDSYATGSVTGGKGSHVGGLIGYVNQTNDDQQMMASYSTGVVTTSGGFAGGFAGYSKFTAYFDYWNTTTSGITDLSQGAGQPKNANGLKGQTTTQLQAGMPTGFNNGINNVVWAQSPSINGGLPYLISVPPD